MPNPSELDRLDQQLQVPSDSAWQPRDEDGSIVREMITWDCKIGEVDAAKLPPGSDLPMRKAVAAAFKEITGEEPEFIFSGWGAQLLERERAVVENRLPDPMKIVEEMRNGRGW